MANSIYMLYNRWNQNHIRQTNQLIKNLVFGSGERCKNARNGKEMKLKYGSSLVWYPRNRDFQKKCGPTLFISTLMNDEILQRSWFFFTSPKVTQNGFLSAANQLRLHIIDCV